MCIALISYLNWRRLDMRKALAKTFWVATIPGAVYMAFWVALLIFGYALLFLSNRFAEILAVLTFC